MYFNKAFDLVNNNALVQVLNATGIADADPRGGQSGHAPPP